MKHHSPAEYLQTRRTTLQGTHNCARAPCQSYLVWSNDSWCSGVIIAPYRLEGPYHLRNLQTTIFQRDLCQIFLPLKKYFKFAYINWSNQRKRRHLNLWQPFLKNAKNKYRYRLVGIPAGALERVPSVGERIAGAVVRVLDEPAVLAGLAHVLGVEHTVGSQLLTEDGRGRRLDALRVGQRPQRVAEFERKALSYRGLLRSLREDLVGDLAGHAQEARDATLVAAQWRPGAGEPGHGQPRALLQRRGTIAEAMGVALQDRLDDGLQRRPILAPHLGTRLSQRVLMPTTQDRDTAVVVQESQRRTPGDVGTLVAGQHQLHRHAQPRRPRLDRPQRSSRPMRSPHERASDRGTSSVSQHRLHKHLQSNEQRRNRSAHLSMHDSAVDGERQRPSLDCAARSARHKFFEDGSHFGLVLADDVKDLRV